MNKKMLILTAILAAFSMPASADEEFHIIMPEDLINVDQLDTNQYVAKPSQVAKAQSDINSSLQRMYENQTLPELARYAVSLNQAKIRAARIAGKTPPKALTREILSDRDKIIEYLKEEYKVEY